MKAKLTLAGVAAMAMAVASASADDPGLKEGATLQQYTDYLLNTYGADSTVTSATIEGTTKGGQSFSVMAPEMMIESAEACGVLWTGAACTSWISTPGSTTMQNHFCSNRRTVNGVAYEVQYDLLYFLNGRWNRSSRLLDCQNACSSLPGTVSGAFCP